METLLYILRHGESVGNRDRRFLGHTDGALTERGVQQATLAGAYLAEMGLRPDKIYASPLSRAWETARLAATPLLEAPPLLTPSAGLIEIAAGAWESMLFSEIERQYPDEMHVWRHDNGNAHPVGGEAVAALYCRVIETVMCLSAENAGKTLLFGTHATPLRAIETCARGMDASGMAAVKWATNASLSAYLCDGKHLKPIFYSYDGYLGEYAYVPHLS